MEFNDWDMEVDDSQVEQSSGSNDGFKVLPAGKYSFTIAKVEHSVYQPKDGKTTGITKPCKMIKLGIIVDGGPAGHSFVDDNLYCWPNCLHRVMSVLKSIGAISDGFKGTLPIDELKGGTGVCRVKVKTYPKRDGSEGERNEIDTYYKASEASAAVTDGEEF